VGEPVNILAIETATPGCAMAVRTSEGVELELVLGDEPSPYRGVDAGNT